MINFNELKNILLANQSFLITTHVNPDADAIGSEIALYLILKRLGKKIRIVNHSSTPYNLKFLDPENVIEKYDAVSGEQIFNEADAIIVVDLNRTDRVVSMREGLSNSKKIKICIDHHLDPEDFTKYQFIDQNYSATGQIIYDLIKKTGIVNMSREIAYPIYSAIMTDTGSFRFDRTTPEIHRIAAELLAFDIHPEEVYDKIYDQSKFSKNKLLGRALNGMELYGPEQKIAYLVLTQKDFKELSAEESDTEGFVNFTLSVEGVRIGMMFIELKNGFKVSFRSKGSVPVNKLAAEFGGGGHTNAAGTRIFDSRLNDNIKMILDKAVEYLK